MNLSFSKLANPSNELFYTGSTRSNKSNAEKQKEKASKELKMKCWKSKSIDKGNLEISTAPAQIFFKSAFLASINDSGQPIKNTVVEATPITINNNSDCYNSDQIPLELCPKTISFGKEQTVALHNQNHAAILSSKGDQQSYNAGSEIKKGGLLMKSKKPTENRQYQQQHQNKSQFYNIPQCNTQFGINNLPFNSSQVQNQPPLNRNYRCNATEMQVQSTQSYMQDCNHTEIPSEQSGSILSRFMDCLHKLIFKNRFTRQIRHLFRKHTPKPDYSQYDEKIYQKRQGLRMTEQARDQQSDLLIVQTEGIDYNNKSNPPRHQSNYDEPKEARIYTQQYSIIQYQLIEETNDYQFDQLQQHNSNMDYERQWHNQTRTNPQACRSSTQCSVDSSRFNLPYCNFSSYNYREYLLNKINNQIIWDGIRDFDVANRRSQVCDLIRQELDMVQAQKVRVVTVKRSNGVSRLLVPAGWKIQLVE